MRLPRRAHITAIAVELELPGPAASMRGRAR